MFGHNGEQQCIIPDYVASVMRMPIVHEIMARRIDMEELEGEDAVYPSLAGTIDCTSTVSARPRSKK